MVEQHFIIKCFWNNFFFVLNFFFGVESNWLETNEKNSEFFNCKITKLPWLNFVERSLFALNRIELKRTKQFNTKLIHSAIFSSSSFSLFSYFFFFFASSSALFLILSFGCALFVYLPNESSLKYLYFVSLLKSFSVFHPFYYFSCTAHNFVWAIVHVGKCTWKSFGVQHSTTQMVYCFAFGNSKNIHFRNTHFPSIIRRLYSIYGIQHLCIWTMMEKSESSKNKLSEWRAAIHLENFTLHKIENL